MIRKRFTQWILPGTGLKRWLFLLLLGMISISVATSLVLLRLVGAEQWLEWAETSRIDGYSVAVLGLAGSVSIIFSVYRLSAILLAPYRRPESGHVIDAVVNYNRRQKGLRFVAIGGGTGLPASLRGIKQVTSNITAIVTVADDGGSSGRLRRDLGVAPPGDLRNNIAALADDASLLTQLFQYRFTSGDLEGHAFGNLFIAALTNIVDSEAPGDRNSLAKALTVVGQVLNVQGRVLPATLDDVYLTAQVRLSGTTRSIKIRGESHIGNVDGQLEQIEIVPANAEAYPDSVQAILDADVVVIGPGSLYTSILPNLMVKGISDALRATTAYKIYVCNVATQPVETEGYTVAEHVMALEKHIGRGVFQAVLANNVFPSENAGINTHYVEAAPDNHEILQRYEVRYTDLTDAERPWRHDPYKLGQAILNIANQEYLIATPFIPSVR